MKGHLSPKQDAEKSLKTLVIGALEKMRRATGVSAVLVIAVGTLYAIAKYEQGFNIFSQPLSVLGDYAESQAALIFNTGFLIFCILNNRHTIHFIQSSLHAGYGLNALTLTNNIGSILLGLAAIIPSGNTQFWHRLFAYSGGFILIASQSATFILLIKKKHNLARIAKIMLFTSITPLILFFIDRRYLGIVETIELTILLFWNFIAAFYIF